MTYDQIYEIVRGTGYVTRGQAGEITELVLAASGAAIAAREQETGPVGKVVIHLTRHPLTGEVIRADGPPDGVPRKVIGYTWTQAGGKHRSVGAAPHPTNAHNIEPIYYPFSTPPAATPRVTPAMVEHQQKMAADAESIGKNLDAIRGQLAATPAAPGEVTDARAAFNAMYEKYCERPLTIRTIAWRCFQAGAALSNPAPVAAPASDQLLEWLIGHAAIEVSQVRADGKRISQDDQGELTGEWRITFDADYGLHESEDDLRAAIKAAKESKS